MFKSYPDRRKVELLAQYAEDILEENDRFREDTTVADFTDLVVKASRVASEKARLSRWMGWRQGAKGILENWSCLALLLGIITSSDLKADV